jgi:hypothetical protein
MGTEETKCKLFNFEAKKQENEAVFEVPEFIKTAVLIGLTAFVGHIAKELTKLTDIK